MRTVFRRWRAICSTPPRSPRCRAVPTSCFWPAGSSGRSIEPTSRGRRTRSCPRAWPSTSAQSRMVVFSTGNVYPLVPASGRGVHGGRPAGAGRRVRAVLPRTRARRGVRLARTRHAGGHLPAELRGGPALRHARGHRAPRVRRRADRPHGRLSSTRSGRGTRTAMRCAASSSPRRRRRFSTSPAPSASASAKLRSGSARASAGRPDS